VTAPLPDAPSAWQGEALERALHDTLMTPRLALEPLAEQHADELWLPVTDARLYEYVPQDPPVSMAALRERLSLLAARRSPQGDQLWLNWVMREREGGGLRGRLQATVLTDATAWIAYEVFPDHWRQGYASEGIQRMIEWLIDTLAVQHVAAEVDSLNEGSLRVLERLGFQRAAWREAADEFKGRISHEWTLRLDATRFARLHPTFTSPIGAHGLP
jgi:RimJ/RimL family protein N-acetyltransferase